VGQESEGINRKWNRSVMGQQDVGYECEILSRMWGRPVMVSAVSGAGL